MDVNRVSRSCCCCTVAYSSDRSLSMSRERLVVISNPGRCSLLPLIIKVRLHRERWVYQNLRLPSVVGQYGIVMSPHASLVVIVPFDESTAVFLDRLSVVKG